MGRSEMERSEKRREEKGRGCSDLFNLKYLYTMDSLEKQNCLWSTITDAVEKFFFFFVVVDYVKMWTGFVSSQTLQPYLFFTCHSFIFAASPFSFFSIWFVGQVMHGLYNTRCMWVSVCTKSNQRLYLQMCNNWGVRVWIYLPEINFYFFNFYFFFPLSISLPFWDKLGEEIFQDQFFLYSILNIQNKKSQPLFHFLFSSPPSYLPNLPRSNSTQTRLVIIITTTIVITNNFISLCLFSLLFSYFFFFCSSFLFH